MRGERSMRAYLKAAVTADTFIIIKPYLFFVLPDRQGGAVFPTFTAKFAEVVVTFRPLRKMSANQAVKSLGAEENRGFRR